MIQISKKEICIALEKPELKVGLDKYVYIQKNLHQVDWSQESPFWTKFNGFYKVRRNRTWQQYFYQLLEENKHNSSITFAGILTELFNKTNQYEGSFASKLVASVNPNFAPFDQFTLANIGLKNLHDRTQRIKDHSVRLHGIIGVYKSVCNHMNEFLKSKLGKYLVKEFKEKFPNYNITEIKMVDLVLWQIRS